LTRVASRVDSHQPMLPANRYSSRVKRGDHPECLVGGGREDKAGCYLDKESDNNFSGCSG
jgi:hypothetical protein